jgi:sulfatase maturation enzyme AslB (radical SAM superfamily)
LIEKLLANGAKQLNIHYVISKQSVKFAYQLIDDIKNNSKLKGINAIVFLGLKPKNRGQAFDVLPTDEYIELVNHCNNRGISYGFDSCSSPRYEVALDKSSIDPKLKKNMLSCAERCESSLFSAYVDVEGRYWHCSFGEGMEIANGVDMKTVTNFMDEVWNSDKTRKWRNRLFELNRECPLYKEIHIDPLAATGEFPDKI